ncbi:MAG: site-specific integrase [Acidobacteriota bacterium]|nr:site-specific integrase [Acidobacteriota bacterium]
MTISKLTKRAVDALAPKAQRDFIVWDAQIKGFGVRVSPAGRKSFVVGYRARGSRQFRRLALGAYGVLTVEEARARAKRHLAEVADGDDPGASRRAAKDAPNVRDLDTAFLADVSARNKPSTAVESRRLWTKHIIPPLGNIKVTAVTPADVSRLHRAMRATPYQANRVLALLGVFFSFAEREGITPRGTNPGRDVRPYPEHSRERFLTRDEWIRLGEALRRAELGGVPPAPAKLRKPVTAPTAKHRPKSADTPIPSSSFAIAAIRLLAFTGCRRGEILSLRWDAVDFERGYLRLAATKTGKSVRPLAGSAAALLASLPREIGSPYVFPGASPGVHLKTIARLWDAVRYAAGLSDVRIHDLRHSFASVSATEGDSMLVIRSLLGHADISTTQRYAHLGDHPVNAAADRTAGIIAAMLSGVEKTEER